MSRDEPADDQRVTGRKYLILTDVETGDVIREGAVPIGRLPLAVVWRRLEALGLDLYLRAILDVKQGRAHPQAPMGRRRRLYRDPGTWDILEFWRRYGVRLLRRS